MDAYNKNNNKIRVLHICESYGSGVKTHLDFIGAHLNDYDNVFFISNKNNEFTNLERLIIDNNLSNRKNPIRFLKAVLHLKKIVKQLSPQIVHFHSTYAGITSIFLKFTNIRDLYFVYTPHAYFSQKKLTSFLSNIVKIIERQILKRMDKIIHVSYSEEQHAISNNLLMDKDKSIVIYNGVNTPNAIKSNFNRKPFRVVNVARCEKQKNPKEFIEIAIQILKQGYDCEFTFVGEGSLRFECEEIVNNSPYKTKINFVGFQENINQYLVDADLYLSTSLYEGLPYSVIEAMSVGLPIILSNVTGHRELIEENGYLYNDINEATRYIEDFIINNELFIKQKSNNSKALFINKFSVVKNMEEISNLYNELLS